MAFAIFENVPLWHIDLFALPRIPIPSHQKIVGIQIKSKLYSHYFRCNAKIGTTI